MNDRFTWKALRAGLCAITVVLVAIAGSSGIAQTSGAGAAAQESKPEIEAATIKPVKDPAPNRIHENVDGRRLSTRYTSVRDLIMMAYEVDPRQIVDGPAWLASDEYDIDLVTGDGIPIDGLREEAILRELLADRFQLKFHREQRTMDVYVLEVAKGGPKLKAADAGEADNQGCSSLGVCSFKRRSLGTFARFMQFVVLDRPVVDKTGIEGTFDFTLTWTPDETQFSSMGFHVPVPAADNPNAPPSLSTAMQEQLGLRLEPQKLPAEVLVVDRVERPSEN